MKKTATKVFALLLALILVAGLLPMGAVAYAAELEDADLEVEDAILEDDSQDEVPDAQDSEEPQTEPEEEASAIDEEEEMTVEGEEAQGEEDEAQAAEETPAKEAEPKEPANAAVPFGVSINGVDVNSDNAGTVLSGGTFAKDENGNITLTLTASVNADVSIAVSAKDAALTVTGDLKDAPLFAGKLTVTMAGGDLTLSNANGPIHASAAAASAKVNLSGAKNIRVNGKFHTLLNGEVSLAADEKVSINNSYVVPADPAEANADGGKGTLIGTLPDPADNSKKIGSLTVTAKDLELSTSGTLAGVLTVPLRYTAKGKIAVGYPSVSSTEDPVEIKSGDTPGEGIHKIVLANKSFTVSFDANGHGTAPEQQTVEKDGKATKPTDPTDTEFTFGGWFTDEACTSAYDFDTAVTANLILYAKWTQDTPANYTVSFNMGGHGTAIEAQTVASGGKATKPTDPTDTDFTFGGWFTDEACTAKFDFNTAVTKDLTLYAKWTEDAPTNFTVTFNMGGHGAAIEAQPVASGGKATKPTDPSETGFTFGGWFTDEACTAAYNFNTAVTADLTLYAKWTVATYTVTFNANGHGTAPDAQTVEHGKKATKPTDPTETGYTFGGWFSDKDCTTEYVFDAAVTAEKTLYAKWTVNKYTVKFNANGGKGTMDDVSVTYHQEYVIPKCTFTAPNGKAFDSWTAGGKTHNPGDKVLIGGNVTLVAKWKDASYTVSFDANGGKGSMKSVSVKAGSSYELPKNGFTAPSGKVFKKWDMGKPGSKITVSANVTVKAVWETAATVSYSFTEGGKSSWYRSSEKGAAFVIKRNVDDSKTYDLFNRVLVDGEALDYNDYSIESGSLKLTLKNKYLRTLAKGNHDLEVRFTDGSASTTFTVKTSVKTGDENHIGLWIGLMAVAAAGGITAAVLALRKRKKK